MDLETLRLRARVLSGLRRFFAARGFLEVDTPLLAPWLIPEASLEVFAVAGRPGPLYLVPSPELWMKRLLCAGSGSIFQLCRCFRSAEPPAAMHLPEFTMLEWYAVGADYLDNLETQEELIAELCGELALGTTLRVGQNEVDCRPPFLRLSMAEAFHEHLGFDLGEGLRRGSLAREAQARGLEVTGGDSPGDLFHKLYLGFVEPCLPRHKPVFLTDYPAVVPTLAKVPPGSPWAQRWELYLGGVEIANCYTEESDARRVEAFFRSQEAAKASAIQPHPTDWALADLLPEHLPACSGVALGVDRLLAVLVDAPGIAGVTPFALPKLGPRPGAGPDTPGEAGDPGGTEDSVGPA